MRKMLSVIAAALLTLQVCMPAYAAETVSQVPGNTDISVYAKYVDNTGFTIISTDKDGNGSVTLPDGTEITVNGADTAKGRIIVEEVTEKEAIDWIAEQLGDRTKSVKTYHIYFLAENSVSMPTDSVSVTIKTKNVSVDSVYAVSNDQIDKLQSAFDNDKITFATNNTYFYALCNDSENVLPQQPNFPFWIILIVVIGCATLFVVVYIKKRKR